MVSRWLYLLALMPCATVLLESGGDLPITLYGIAATLLLTLVIAILAWRLRCEYRRVVELSETDPLTGLGNRRRFNVDLAREVARAHRLDLSLVLAYLDVDRFKAINDSRGHAAGDSVLKQVAAILRSSVRESVDACYRVGGDEFAVLLPAVDYRGRAGIIKRLQQLGERAGDALAPYQSGVSLGVAVLRLNDSPRTFLRRADENMFVDKVRKTPPNSGHVLSPAATAEAG